MSVAIGDHRRTVVSDPYGEQALLTPAMTEGYDAVSGGERHLLLRYLEAVVAARQAPVHTAVAFNAVYFGYDLGGDGYGGSPLRIDDFPVVSLGGCAPVLPVGAMVSVATGSAPLYAEIVHREGAHPAVGSLGDVPAWVSGAPVGATGPGSPATGSTLLRKELLVPDLDAFGPALSPSLAQIHRLRTRQRWINEDGHLVVDVVHPSPGAARRDDLTAYVDHFLTTAREQLLSPFVPVSLAELVGGTSDDELRAGLFGLLDTVRGVLGSSTSLRTWGHYVVSRNSLAECRRDPGPLGGGDLRSLAAAVEHAADPVRRRHGLTAPGTAYTAVGPRLRQFPGATELLRGVGYAAAVCRANLTIADILREDSDQGLFENGSRVTLDDVFESGGVWRSHYPGGADAPADPLTPAGRGWASTLPAPLEPEAGTDAEADVDPVDSPLGDDASLGPCELLRNDTEEIIWRAPLRLVHLVDGWFPLHPLVTRELHGSLVPRPTSRLELDHVGQVLNEGEGVQHATVALADGAGRLMGIHWPVGFFPGLMLQLSWRRGEAVLRAATVLLAEPFYVGDRMIGHCYDPHVLTREDAPGSDRHGDSAVGLDPRQLVMRTVRRCGLLTLDGHALLDRSVLPSAVYGRRPVRSRAVALEKAVVELLAERLLEPALGSRDAGGQPHYPAREGQPTIPLIGYRPVWRRVVQPWGGTEPESSNPLALQTVAGHLRRLRPDRSPSKAQRVAFREHCRRLGKADGWELPYGYTFVTEHTRGR
ncbi:hypothetical protein [Streptomyces sp. V2I9]|uniref:hypothetical protein n=1 Tax=Streptomyces sp. V2I9 TaxID=3042304 RepID=UPI0027D7D895|nr:hypothetical protein [Streptomyces sp. V2I9]